MAFTHDNLVQAQRDLEAGLILLGKAKGEVSRAIGLAGDATTTPDGQHTYWAALNTAVGTAITNVKTAIADVYYSPEQVHG